eukprot:CAMPEP_0172190436 /NCGR_PEP_ID=MMETSP1050-20130122/23115_1 /TAXON_ID=233186 /ORGANISM="Cryptomonas curvata, Strain CCAP979/52" /LENGTH=118 /DNA_ID=CAMNT_0012865315 /DNA_START=594 /DNA_END=949 /DNA_ORIENTATION=+
MLQNETVAYTVALSVDTVTLHHSNACNTRALCNETLVLEVLDEQAPAVFCLESFNALALYYEEVLNMPGAGGSPEPKSSNAHSPPALHRQPAPSAADAAGAAGADPPPLVAWEQAADE